MSEGDTARVGRRRAASDVAGQLVLRVANLGLGVVVTLLVVRSLGESGFGQWSTILAVTTLAGYFGNLGLERVAVERAASEPELLGEWVGSLLTLRLMLAVPVTIGAAIVAVVIADGGEMTTAAILLSATLLITPLTAGSVIFQVQVRNVLSTALEIANGLAWAALVVALVLLDATGLVIFAAGFAFLTALTSAAYLVVAHRRVPIRLAGSRQRWRPLLQVGLTVGLSGLLVLGYGYVDQIIVFEIAGPRDAGLYGASYRIFERLQFLPVSLMMTLYPIIVMARDVDPERVRRVLALAVDYLLMFSLPVLTITLAGPEEIVRLLFGAGFIDAAPALVVLTATFVVISVSYPVGYLVVSYGLQRSYVLIALMGLVFNVTANLVLVPRYGFLAAAWVTLATELLVNAFALTTVCRRMGFVPRGSRTARITAAAVSVGVIAWLLRVAGLPVIVWGALAGIIYLAALLVLRVLDIAELRGLRGSGATNSTSERL